jgi:flagellin-like hook-associated protein FlgL
MVQSLVDMRSQLADLQRQLSTGMKSDTYAGLGIDRGLTVGLRAHLSAISSFDDTINNVNVRLSLAQTTLGRISDIGSSVKQSISATSTTSAQIAQQTARSSLGELLGLLNTQSGDRYIYSGMASDKPAVDTVDNILDGDGVRAGLTQVIAERNQADLGANGLGRLVLSSPSPTSVSIGEDVAGSIFGFKLANATASNASVTVTGPTGSPPSASFDLGATNLNDGDTVTLAFNLPDGTSQTLTMTATTAAPPGPNQFTIGANSTATAANLQSALQTSIGTLARTTLSAASAVKASDEFFNSNPPLRVNGTPATATGLTNGTAANTVFWYTGENGPTSARSTATAQVDQSISVSYGMRANEEAIRWTVQNVATLAAMTFSATDPDAQARSAALNDRLRPNLDVPPGTQKIQDIQAEIAGAQTTLSSAQTRHQQTTSTLSDFLQQLEGVSNEQVSAQILAMQTSLQASLSTTALLYKTSILQYI